MDLSGPANPEKAVVLMRKDATRSGRQLLLAVAAATLATCALLPVNGSAPAATQTHATTTAAGPAAVSTSARTRYDRIAVQTLEDIVNGDFTAATAHFDATVRKLLPPDALAGAWGTYQAKFGPYQSHGDPKDDVTGEFTVVNVPLRMERRPGEFRVTFHEDGTIAGLWFLEAGVPIS